MSTNAIRNSLQELLGLMSEPIAVTFCNSAPAGIKRVASAAPAGCAYWKLAAGGEVFYTTAEDHLNCPIGAYTHGAELSGEVQEGLESTIRNMVDINYMKIEEVAAIPRRSEPLQFLTYAPLSKAQGTPDIVLLRGSARQVMMLIEAATSIARTSPLPIMGRPACAMIPAALATDRVTSSLACIGNRVYTDSPDGEFYVSIPGNCLTEIIEALHFIVAANSELEQHHRARCSCA